MPAFHVSRVTVLYVCAAMQSTETFIFILRCFGESPVVTCKRFQDPQVIYRRKSAGGWPAACLSTRLQVLSSGSIVSESDVVFRSYLILVEHDFFLFCVGLSDWFFQPTVSLFSFIASFLSVFRQTRCLIIKPARSSVSFSTTKYFWKLQVFFNLWSKHSEADLYLSFQAVYLNTSVACLICWW